MHGTEVFALQDGKRIAISDCGWNPCNYAVLTDPDVLRTKNDGNLGIDKERQTENMSSTEMNVSA